jgi:CHAT domain-containing protein
MLKARKGWFDALEKVTEDLWKKMMEKVVRHIRSLGFEGAFLVSTGLLSLLPLYASWWIMDGQRHYALDEISFAFAPSARTLAQAKRIAASTQANKLLAIDEPRPVKASPLPNSHKEVTAVKCFFKETVVLEHEKAKRNDLLQMLPKAEVAHFSCHGSVDWIDPSKSCLLMANDETLTIKDLFGMKLKGARMATLSACETGVIGTHLPDEVVSLPSAFMKAGFAGVVASLWTVPDLSTSMLMESFYSFWKKEGLTPVQALREAQMQLREVNGFEHPFYWAAFYLTGL